MSDIETLHKAVDVAAADCMREIGFKDWDSAMLTVSDPGSYTEPEVFSHLDPSHAAESGYGSTKTGESEALAAKVRRPHRSPTKDEIQAHIGGQAKTQAGVAIPMGGCGDEGSRRVIGTESKLPVDARGLAAQAMSSAIRDSRVRRAMQQWSSCMAEHGLKYDTPAAAQQDLKWANRSTDKPASAEEIKTASIDAACQRDTDSVAIYMAAERAYQAELLTANKDKLEKAKPMLEGWVKHARAILAKTNNGS